MVSGRFGAHTAVRNFPPKMRIKGGDSTDPAYSLRQQCHRRETNIPVGVPRSLDFPSESGLTEAHRVLQRQV